MRFEVGQIFEGKVTKIMKFGAFVSLPDEKSGLIHVSEIANKFVEKISDYLKEGQIVKVKIIKIYDDGKINLSLRQAQKNEESPSNPPLNNNAQNRERQMQAASGFPKNFSHSSGYSTGKNFKKITGQNIFGGSSSFEHLLEKFKKDSEQQLHYISNSQDVKRKKNF